MRLPRELENIIFEFHDEYGMVEKKQRINYIITRSYQNWLSDAGVYSRWFVVDEYQAKREIYPFVEPNIFITNATLWQFFLKYFRHCETRLLVKSLCLPSCYSQI